MGKHYVVVLKFMPLVKKFQSYSFGTCLNVRQLTVNTCIAFWSGRTLNCLHYSTMINGYCAIQQQKKTRRGWEPARLSRAVKSRPAEKQEESTSMKEGNCTHVSQPPTAGVPATLNK